MPPKKKKHQEKDDEELSEEEKKELKDLEEEAGLSEGASEDIKELIETEKQEQEKQLPLVSEVTYSISLHGTAIITHCKTLGQAKNAYRVAVDAGEIPFVGSNISVSYKRIGLSTYFLIFHCSEFTERRS